MTRNVDAVGFIESAVLPAIAHDSMRAGSALESAQPTVDLGQLGDGVVSGNTLIDFSSVAADSAVRSAVSLAMLFASRAASGQLKEGDDEDDWFAAYVTGMSRLGFAITQTSVQKNEFKKKGLYVHNSIIPFLTVALGGAAVGPVILAALQNLSDMDKDRPWVTLFDRESRKFDCREMHFAAVGTDSVNTHIRHVMARLRYVSSGTSVLFFKVTKESAEFESATTTMTANNSLLAVLEPRLRERMQNDMYRFLAEAPIGESVVS